MTIEVRCIGASQDGRANVWRVTCRCGHVFSPHDTMFARQEFDCPKCRASYVANWNIPIVEIAE